MPKITLSEEKNMKIHKFVHEHAPALAGL